ncbi:MAG: hypothetical protein JNJ57_19250 [Saprospiraceae bacterium]|nr:hypothetical protein [Saprospiraceae bacterium]
MRNYFLLLVFCCFLNEAKGQFVQTDSPETLRWVEQQGLKVDSLLDNAILSHEHVNLILKLMDAYLIFDAITLNGLYCAEAQQAAHSAKNYCDVLNFRLEKDMNMAVLRATLARQETAKMLNGVRRCLISVKPADAETAAFAPIEVIRKDAELAILDFSDGAAAGNFHILAQKIEHSIRLLQDIDHLASTFDACEQVRALTRRAIGEAEQALQAYNWEEVHNSINRAIQTVTQIGASSCR